MRRVAGLCCLLVLVTVASAGDRGTAEPSQSCGCGAPSYHSLARPAIVPFPEITTRCLCPREYMMSSGTGSVLWRCTEYSHSAGSCTLGSTGFRSFPAGQEPGTCTGILGCSAGCVSLGFSSPLPSTGELAPVAYYPPPSYDFSITTLKPEPTPGDDVYDEGFGLNMTDTQPMSTDVINGHIVGEDVDTAATKRKKVKLRVKGGTEHDVVPGVVFEVKFHRKRLLLPPQTDPWPAYYGYEIEKPMNGSVGGDKPVSVRPATFNQPGEAWPPTPTDTPITGLYEVRLKRNGPTYFVRTKTELETI